MIVVAGAVFAALAMFGTRGAQAVSRCQVLAAAQAWVDAGVMYSWDAWYTDPTTGLCCYRTDCSGYVSAVWQLPPPGHTTYSLAGGVWDDGVSYVIAAEELQPGDALNYPGSPSAGTGHVMLYVSGDFWSGSVEVYEEFGHGNPAVRRWRSIDTSLYLPIRYVDIEPCCTPHCEGSIIVGEDCVRGDCAAYGANCVEDALGVRCVFFACPPVGTTDVCVTETVIGSCVDGSLVSSGDCAAYAGLCTTAGGQPAHCASIFCVTGPSDVPVVHDICFVDGQRYTCDGTGNIGSPLCPAGEMCSVYPEIHCEAGLPCPPEGDVNVCYRDEIVARCYNGGIVQVASDCVEAGGFCSTAGGAEPHCVSALCVESAGEVPAEHDVCLPDGRIAHCSASGEVGSESDCPAGQTCIDDGGGARCGEAGPEAGPDSPDDRPDAADTADVADAEGRDDSPADGAGDHGTGGLEGGACGCVLAS
jgi:hypothetical protein